MEINITIKLSEIHETHKPITIPIVLDVGKEHLNAVVDNIQRNGTIAQAIRNLR